MSYIEHDDGPVLTPAEQRLANAEQRVAQAERANAKLREALEETNKWLDGHIVLVGGDESPAEPADSFSSEAVSMITANNRALGKF